MTNVTDIFASKVFNLSKMQERLPEDVYNNLKIHK